MLIIGMARQKDPATMQKIVEIIGKYGPISTYKLLKLYSEKKAGTSGKWLSKTLDFLAGLGTIEYITVKGEKPWQMYGGWVLTKEATLFMKVYKDWRRWLLLAFWLVKRNPTFKFGDLQGRRLNEFLGFPHVEPGMVWRIVEDLITDNFCFKCLVIYNEFWRIIEIQSGEKKIFKCQNPNHIDSENLSRQRKRSINKKLEKELDEVRRLINHLRLKSLLEKRDMVP